MRFDADVHPGLTAFPSRSGCLRLVWNGPLAREMAKSFSCPASHMLNGFRFPGRHVSAPCSHVPEDFQWRVAGHAAAIIFLQLHAKWSTPGIRKGDNLRQEWHLSVYARQVSIQLQEYILITHGTPVRLQSRRDPRPAHHVGQPQREIPRAASLPFWLLVPS